MDSLRTSAALTDSEQAWHVTSGKEAMEILVQDGLSAIHDHEISPLIHRAASELINRDDKGQRTDIMSVGFPHIVLMDVAQQLAALAISAFTSEQILDALQSYTVGLGAEFAREAQAKPLYARIIVTDKKPDDLPECELIQVTLIDGERRIGDALGQRVMQSTIYGTRTSMTRDMSVSEMLAVSRKKMLMIYYGAPSGQDVQGLDNIELNLIHIAAGLSDIMSETDQQILQAAIRANPRDVNLSEILRSFSDIQKLLQPQRGAKSINPNIRMQLTNKIVQIQTQLEALVTKNITTPNPPEKRMLEGGFIKEESSERDGSYPPRVLVLLANQLQTLVSEHNIPLVVSAQPIHVSAANDDVFATNMILGSAVQGYVMDGINSLAQQLPSIEQTKLLNLVAQVQTADVQVNKTGLGKGLDEIKAILITAATQESISPQSYATIAKILPELAVAKAEMRTNQERIAAASTLILSALTDVHEVLAAGKSKILPPSLQQVKADLDTIIQAVERQEGRQIASIPSEIIQVALQSVRLSAPETRTTLGLQVQKMLVTLTQPDVQQEMLRSLKPEGASSNQSPDVGVRPVNMARDSTVLGDVQQVIGTLQNIPRQYPQVMDAALTTFVLQSLPVPSSPVLVEKMEAVRLQGVAGVVQAVDDGILPSTVMTSLITPYIQHNPAVANPMVARMITAAIPAQADITQKDASALHQIAQIVEVNGYGTLQSPTMQNIINTMSPMAQTVLQSSIQQGTAVTNGSFLVSNQSSDSIISRDNKASDMGNTGGQGSSVPTNPPMPSYVSGLDGIAPSVAVIPLPSFPATGQGHAETPPSARMEDESAKDLPKYTEAKLTDGQPQPSTDKTSSSASRTDIPAEPLVPPQPMPAEPRSVEPTAFVMPSIPDPIPEPPPTPAIEPKEPSILKMEPETEKIVAESMLTEAKLSEPESIICPGGPNCPICSKMFNIASAGKVDLPPSPATIKEEYNCCANGVCPAHAAAAIDRHTDEFNTDKMELGF